MTITHNTAYDRPLTFIDAKGEQVEWAPGDKLSAFDAFWKFMQQRISRENSRFIIEDQTAQEELILLIDRRAICRVKHGNPTVSQYALTYGLKGYTERARSFIQEGGYDALDMYGPWLADEAAVEAALHEDVFKKPTSDKPAHDDVNSGTALQTSLDQAGIIEHWPLWCNQAVDWSAQAKHRHTQDSLTNSNGSPILLPTQTVKDAFIAVGATIAELTEIGKLTKLALSTENADRTFTVLVNEGAVEVSVEIVLGVNNSIDATMAVTRDGLIVAKPEDLVQVTYDVIFQKYKKWPDQIGSIRLVIASYSHLEVVSGGIVALMRSVAKNWSSRTE